ncbi:MAG: DUF3096 domain-containing protein [Xanthomonadaceae bacterium]|nr:DUF3096 domain-containing protein [Xanthomonadaceae bacterium]
MDLPMDLHPTLAPLIALFAGILFLIVPRLLNRVVAINPIVSSPPVLLGAGACGRSDHAEALGFAGWLAGMRTPFHFSSRGAS